MPKLQREYPGYEKECPYKEVHGINDYDEYYKQ